MSEEDWDILTRSGALCDKDDSLSFAQFAVAMRAQLSLYAQRLLANKMEQSIQAESEHAPILFAMKVMMEKLMRENADDESGFHSPSYRKSVADDHIDHQPHCFGDEEMGNGIGEASDGLRAVMEELGSLKHEIREERMLAAEERKRTQQDRVLVHRLWSLVSEKDLSILTPSTVAGGGDMAAMLAPVEPDGDTLQRVNFESPRTASSPTAWIRVSSAAAAPPPPPPPPSPPSPPTFHPLPLPNPTSSMHMAWSRRMSSMGYRGPVSSKGDRDSETSQRTSVVSEASTPKSPHQVARSQSYGTRLRQFDTEEGKNSPELSMLRSGEIRSSEEGGQRVAKEAQQFGVWKQGNCYIITPQKTSLSWAPWRPRMTLGPSTSETHATNLKAQGAILGDWRSGSPVQQGMPMSYTANTDSYAAQAALDADHMVVVEKEAAVSQSAPLQGRFSTDPTNPGRKAIYPELEKFASNFKH